MTLLHRNSFILSVNINGDLLQCLEKTSSSDRESASEPSSFSCDTMVVTVICDSYEPRKIEFKWKFCN